MAKRRRRLFREVNVEDLGSALRAARKRKKISLRAMTEPIGSSPTAVLKIELQRSGWQLSTMIKLFRSIGSPILSLRLTRIRKPQATAKSRLRVKEASRSPVPSNPSSI